jgi:competence protein ComFB
MADFQMVNKMEVAVQHTLEDILSRNNAICKCERCRLDLMALALNNLPPRYVVTTFGDIMTQFDLESFQWKTDVMISVIRALEVVKQKPRHKI